MKKSIEKALNDQFNLELLSSYAYLAMSGYFENAGFSGFANWMRKQSEEEHTHAMKIYKYMFDRDVELIFNSIGKPKHSWKKPKDVFEDSLKNEIKVSKSINAIIDLAIKEKDHATNEFLHWFVMEQIEEESSIKNILHKFSLIGDNKAALIMLDKELGSRES